jgi:hypothetical protein
LVIKIYYNWVYISTCPTSTSRPFLYTMLVEEMVKVSLPLKHTPTTVQPIVSMSLDSNAGDVEANVGLGIRGCSTGLFGTGNTCSWPLEPGI